MVTGGRGLEFRDEDNRTDTEARLPTPNPQSPTSYFPMPIRIMNVRFL